MNRSAVLVTLTLVTALAATGCSGDDGPSIVVYNAQHEQLLEEIAPAFTEETGIEVELRNGKDPELSASSSQEGDASPGRRVPHRELPGDVGGGGAPGCSRSSSGSDRSPIPAQYRPTSGAVDRLRRPLDRARLQHRRWSTRTSCPTSILDLADPEWAGHDLLLPDRRRLPGDRGRGARPRGRAGDPRRGSTASRPTARSTTATTSCSRPSTPASPTIGIIYHYYWYRDQAEAGDISDDSELYFFGNQDPGAFVSVSGAGVLASERPPDGRREVHRVPHQRGGPAGLADSYALEYPLNPAVELEPPVKPFSELQPPQVDVSDLDGEKVVDLMTEVGFL